MVSVLLVLGVIIVTLLFSIWLFTLLDISGLNSIYIKWFVVIAYPLTIIAAAFAAREVINNVQTDIQTYKENAIQIANSFVNAIGNQPINPAPEPQKTYVNGDALTSNLN